MSSFSWCGGNTNIFPGKDDREKAVEHTPSPVCTEYLPASDLEQKGKTKTVCIFALKVLPESRKKATSPEMGKWHWMRVFNLFYFVVITVK